VNNCQRVTAGADLALCWSHGQQATPPHKLMTRRQQLFALAAQLHELTTEEEREDYPFWDHLNDLINDMEIEED
jgi:hypothetical protein